MDQCCVRRPLSSANFYIEKQQDSVEVKDESRGFAKGMGSKFSLFRKRSFQLTRKQLIIIRSSTVMKLV